MENIQQQTIREKRSGWLVLLLSVLSALIAAVFPVALVVAPALWAYAGARTKPYWIVIPAVAFAVTAFSSYTLIPAAGLSGAALLASILLYALLTRRVSNAYTALTLAGVFLVGLYVSVCLPGIFDGRGAFADAQAAIGSLFDQYRSAASQMPELNVQNSQAILDVMDAYVKEIPNFVVSALCIFAGVLGLGNLLFFRLFCRKQPEISISPMRVFRDWTLPRSMTFGLFALLIGSLILEWTGWAYSESMSNTVNALVGMPLLLQGLCVVDFLIARSPKHINTGRTLAYIGIGVLFSLAQTPLILLGCFDQIFRVRDRMRGVPPRAAI